ncbi:MAG TPA: ester cyclase [Terriglobales bacterium]|nr:ester cyclase [Terriglobales bacterium]
MPREENVEALQRAMLRFKARDLDGYFEMYTPSVIHHGFSSRIRPGLPGLRDHYNQLLKAFPDMRVDIADIIADGEKVAHRFTFHGTHKGEFLKVPASGKLVTAGGVHIQHFQAGKCIEVWQVLDTFGFLQQIGALPRLRDALSGQ